ncbi:MAG: inositol monophosphatase [Actinomycetota bacterium]|nr:inositol monophosphatase [Actinomycetota bacterium]MDQ2958426.1 inositol monophosphatase [Actinomycetota bacterium]
MTDNASGGPVPNPAELTELAVGLAGLAGTLMLDRRSRGLSISTKSSVTDIVTDADHAVERLLRGELARLRPADSILGEEGGEHGRPDAAVRWLLDPIDGTVNFMLGLPQFAVSIAAQVQGRTVAGCVLNPVSGDLFQATLGRGAYLGDRRLTGPRSVPLAEAVVATGFGYDPQLRARQGRIVGELLGRVGNLRRLGSAALDLCALAAGWIDLYYEGPLGEWDYAAGLLIAQEAGAVATGLAGGPPGPLLVAAGHPDTAEEFFAVLGELGAGEPV